MANKFFGTDGIRGTANKPPMTAEIALIVGEAAGALAAFALDTGRRPGTVHSDPNLLRSFQRGLLEDGVPLCWLIEKKFMISSSATIGVKV